MGAFGTIVMKIVKFRKKLMEWFEENHRNFSWRKTKDPYKILIAEILLQRTRAENVEAVYTEFLNKYPNVRRLAKTDVEEIAKCIAPLGLKKRALILKNISAILLQEYNGRIPKNEKELMNIKGIGFYIAYAVVCFAYGKKKAVVDCNVSRVINRIFGYKIKTSPHSDKKFITFVQSLLPDSDPKKYNWAILDFSAIVCKPRKPRCDICPLSDICNYYKTLNLK